MQRLELELVEIMQWQLHIKYYEERVWSKKHKLDIEKWPIEKLYKSQGHKIKFFTRVNEIRKRQADKFRENERARGLKWEEM